MPRGFPRAIGRTDQAIAFDEFAVARDPVNSRAQSNLGFDYMSAGRMDDAIARWRTALALSPGFIGASYSIGAARDCRASRKPPWLRRSGDSEVWRRIGLPMAYFALGRHAESDAALAELIKVHERERGLQHRLCAAFRGEVDQAFEWLARRWTTATVVCPTSG